MTPVLTGFTLLLLLQLAGEALVRGLALPLPGPVVGLLLALALLRYWPRSFSALKAAADVLLPHLSLLFVPAGVGVVMYLKALREDGWAIAIALVLSTWIGLAVTAWVAERFMRHKSDAETARPPRKS
jgi:holin-like protein